MKWLKIQRERRGLQGAERGRSQALAKFAAVLGVLAFVLLLTSITSPPVGHAAFPGANGKIVFGSTRDNPDGDIYVMNADGSGVTRLTTEGGAVPAWSPDGTKIAFRAAQTPAVTSSTR